MLQEFDRFPLLVLQIVHGDSGSQVDCLDFVLLRLWLGLALAQLGEKLAHQIFPVIGDLDDRWFDLCITEHEVLLHCLCLIKSLLKGHVCEQLVVLIVDAHHAVVIKVDLLIVNVVLCASDLTESLHGD